MKPASIILCILLLCSCKNGERWSDTQPSPGQGELSGTDQITLFSIDFDPETVYPQAVVKKEIVYMPVGSWSYAHHPSVTYFQGAFYTVFSNGLRGEDEPGQRVVISTSRDFCNWTTPQVLAEPSPGDYGTRKILTPGGICVCNGKLVVYITENDCDGVSTARLNPKLYALVSPDGRTWSKAVELSLAIFPSHRPLRLSTGRLIMTCNRALYYSDDPSGVGSWHRCLEAPQDQTGHITVPAAKPSLCEGEVFEHANGTLYCLFRSSGSPVDGHLWQAQSYDGGTSWTAPIKSRFTDNNSKSFFCALSDGRYLYVGTPDNTRQGTRHPLVAALSDDGYHFDRCYILSDDHYDQQYDGRWKGGDYGYPFAYVRDGWLHVVVSRHKERIDAIKCNLSNLK